MTKKLFIIALVIASSSFASMAQSLTFGQALIISDTPSTVPAGKVWKITSIYGVAEGCIGNFNTQIGMRYKKTNSTAFQIDGIQIPVEYNLKSVEHYADNACTSNQSNSYQEYFIGAVWSKVPSTTVFPLWVPAGTTIAAIGSTVKVSVLEFNIVP